MRTTFLFSILLFVGTTLVPASASAQYRRRPPPPDVISYDEEKPIPPGYVRQHRTRKGFLIAGATGFGSSWLGASILGGVLIAEGFPADDVGMLFIPLAGPFILTGKIWGYKQNSDGAVATIATQFASGVFVVNGLMQTTSFTLLTVGLVKKKEVLVRRKSITVNLEPMVQPDRIGAIMHGSF